MCEPSVSTPISRIFILISPSSLSSSLSPSDVTPRYITSLHPVLSHSFTFSGPFASAELFLTGRRIPARQCYERGFLSAVVKDAAALDASVASYTNEFVEAAPGALATCKSLIEYVRTHSHEENVARAQKVFVACLSSGEMKEGLKAFREKRKPSWATIPSKL